MLIGHKTANPQELRGWHCHYGSPNCLTFRKWAEDVQRTRSIWCGLSRVYVLHPEHTQIPELTSLSNSDIFVPGDPLLDVIPCQSIFIQQIGDCHHIPGTQNPDCLSKWYSDIVNVTGE